MLGHYMRVKRSQLLGRVKHRKITLKWLRNITKVIKALSPYLMCISEAQEHISRGLRAADTIQGCEVLRQLHGGSIEFKMA